MLSWFGLVISLCWNVVGDRVIFLFEAFLCHYAINIGVELLKFLNFIVNHDFELVKITMSINWRPRIRGAALRVVSVFWLSIGILLALCLTLALSFNLSFDLNSICKRTNLLSLHLVLESAVGSTGDDIASDVI